MLKDKKFDNLDDNSLRQFFTNQNSPQDNPKKESKILDL